MTFIIPFVPFIMGVAGGLMVWFGMMRLVDFSSSKSVYGKMLSHEFLVHYFNTEWKNYNRLIPNNDILVSTNHLLSVPYIAMRGRKSSYSKYTINEIGQIPRKSPYTAIIDRRIEELKSQNP